MKKLSLIIAMILVVTVSGVYATWNYSRNVVDSKQATMTIAVTGTASSAKGVISIDSAPKRVIIDDTEGVNGYDHVAEIWYGDINADSQPIGASQDGLVTFTFTPAATGVDETVKTNGIPLAYTITISSVGSFNSLPIFELVNPTGHFDADGVFTKSINLKDHIKFANEIKLDTYAKYQAFEQAIAQITFTVTISEYVAVNV